MLRTSLSTWLLLFVLASIVPADDRPSRPNVVLILADDLGWTDLAVQGSRYYRSPHVDRLATEGTRFTAAYSNGPNCAPTRASLMSGQYTPRHRIITVGNSARGNPELRTLVPVKNETTLGLDHVTLADALHAAGYRTGMFGKWHLGNGPKHHPLARGFDEAIVSNGRHFGFRTQPKSEIEEGEYLADFLTRHAVGFLERAAAAEDEKPFFLYLPHFAVHTPLEARADDIETWKKRETVGGHNDPVYAAMIQAVDDSVGTVLKTLDRLKVADETVVIFTSDNGGVGGYHDAGVTEAHDITDNAPLHGGKGMLYEGGVRVPLIVRWPGVTKPGTTSGEPVATIDFYPTLLELAGAERPESQHLEGKSLVPVLRDPNAQLDRDALYWHFPAYLQARAYGEPGRWRTTPAGSIRTRRFKLIEYFEDGRLELYDLENDLGERTNLADKMPYRALTLHAQLTKWRREVGARMPTKLPE